MDWHEEKAVCKCGTTWVKGDLAKKPFEDWEFDSARSVQRYLLRCPNCRNMHHSSKDELKQAVEHEDKVTRVKERDHG